MSDNIFKKVWQFLFKKKSLSEEDKLILSELKDLYSHQKEQTLARQKALLAILEENQKKVSGNKDIVSAPIEEESTFGFNEEVTKHLFECDHIWEEFDSVQEYLKRLLAGGDYVEGGDKSNFLRELADVEERLNKIETYYDLLRKDKFIEVAEREAIASRLEEIRQMIDNNKARVASAMDNKEVQETLNEPEEEINGIIPEETKEAKQTEEGFEKDIASLIEEISKKYNLGLSPEEIAALIKKLKNAHLRRLFKEKINILDIGEKEFVRDFDNYNFQNATLQNPNNIIRQFLVKDTQMVSRDDLLQKLGLLSKEKSGDKDLKKLIIPRLKLLETKSQEILERRKKQYAKSKDKFYSTHEKDVEIPKELVSPLTEVLKKHMGLSIGREKFFLRKHKDQFMADAHYVIINGKKQVIDKHLKLLKAEREEALHNRHRKEKKENSAEKLHKKHLKEKVREEHLRHLRELAELEHKKQLYYQMRQKITSASDTKKILLENKIDKTDQQITRVKNAIDEYEKRKLLNKQQAEAQLEKEQKSMQANSNQQQQYRKEMQKQYLEKMRLAEIEKQKRWQQMRNAVAQRKAQDQANAKNMKEKIDQMRSAGGAIVTHNVKGDFSQNNLVGSRFNADYFKNKNENKEYHRDFKNAKFVRVAQSNTQRDVSFRNLKNKEDDLKNNEKGQSATIAASNNQTAVPQMPSINNGKHDQTIHSPSIEGNIIETSMELEKALEDKAHKLREEAMQKNKELLKEEHLNVAAKIDQGKKAFIADEKEQQMHKQDMQKTILEKQEQVKQELQEKQEAETLRMQELQTMREAVLAQKQAKQKEQKLKMEEESAKRRNQMLEEQQQKRQEAKEKMEQEHKRREELRLKMAAEKKQREETLKKQKEEEAKKREILKRAREAEKKQKADAIKKKQALEVAKREALKREKAENLQKKMAEDRKKQLEEKKKADKLRQQKMLEEQKKRREQARKAMEAKENGL